MACEDLKAKADALEASVKTLEAEIAKEPKPEQAASEAALKKLSAEAFAAQQAYAECVAKQAPPPPPVTAITVSGPQSTITTLGPQLAAHATLWNRATADQMDIIGNDFRTLEEIGSAAFTRASNNVAIPNSFTFWYPQTRPSDNGKHYKRTLVGKMQEVHLSSISGTYQDYDLNIDIVPNPNYQDLLTNAHAREYTDIMSAEWNLSLHSDGQPNCDDAASLAERSFLEAEIQVDGNIHSGSAQTLNDMILKRAAEDICVYGPWIYDRGHCCHAEIHPCEQIWWRDDISNGKKYTLSVICDASQRFWWRDQMSDGTKLKPWGAPPIYGLFAIAFQVEFSSVLANAQPLVFEVANIDDYNVHEFPNSNQTYSLVYQGRTLVEFIPHNDAFEVSYEAVGAVAAAGLGLTTTIRGFLVLVTSVGTLTQVPNPLVPPGANVNTVPEPLERVAFRKVEGRYVFSISRTTPQNVVVARG